MSALPAAGVPVAQGVAVPEVLITAESQPATRDGQRNRATSLTSTLKPPPSKRPLGARRTPRCSATSASRSSADCSPAAPPGASQATATRCYSRSPPSPLSAWVVQIEVVSIDYARGHRPASCAHRQAELIVLTGCCTARLAASAARAGIRALRALLGDGAQRRGGRIFGTAFAQADRQVEPSRLDRP